MQYSFDKNNFDINFNNFLDLNEEQKISFEKFQRKLKKEKQNYDQF